MADFGLDIATLPDLDETFSLIAGPRVVAEALARRLSTPRGGLAFYPDYGLEVRAFMSEPFSDELAFRLQTAIERECEKDERVATASAEVTFDDANRFARALITFETSDGAFSLLLGISALSVELLTSGEA